MDLNTITVADFKAQFPRGFPYLPVYSGTQLYNAGALVYYPNTQLLYNSKNNGTLNVLPTDATKWDVTSPQPSVDDYVQDQDITNAFAEAQITFNQALFSTDAQIKLGYLYMTAHYLCNDLKTALSGIMASAFFPMSGRTVGSVSEQYGIPTTYLENPIYSFYTSTAYGMKYLALTLPRMVGNVFVVAGMTRP